jgi:diaminopimelate epimerase
MQIHFYKFHGAGNDFILIDQRREAVALSEQQIAFLCHRRFGIGADGLMLLENSGDYDFRMRYYNSDGREGSMCGNGGRCIVAFADFLGIKKTEYIFEAVDGLHRAKILESGDAKWEVELQMLDVEQVEQRDNHFFLDTGSPHHVEYVADVQKVDVVQRGKNIRYSEEYAPSGTNVNFISEQNGQILIRTYERGVEDETLACGTGVTAAAIAVALSKGDMRNEYVIKALGGDLKVRFERKEQRFTNLWLTGPAAFVFAGEINL